MSVPENLSCPIRATSAAKGTDRPENCGGIPGFYALLEALADPKHRDHADAKEWSADYDPNNFDELPIKYALSRIANRRNAARSRLSKKRTLGSAA
jgi:Plasmid pRiA4b ORF-3-like protein